LSKIELYSIILSNSKLKISKIITEKASGSDWFVIKLKRNTFFGPMKLMLMKRFEMASQILFHHLFATDSAFAYLFVSLVVRKTLAWAKHLATRATPFWVRFSFT
jgi:hypothetical protein